MGRYRKVPTEKEMIEQLGMGEVSLPPLSFRLLESSDQLGGNSSFDALLEAAWDKKRARFVVECESLSTPKMFQRGLTRLKTMSLPKDYLPLLFLPFLSGQRLRELEQEGISGVDLCGNGVVIAPGRFAVFRSGEENRFTTSAPIKNIYRKNSSMVARVFLLRSSYDTVQDICTEINSRNLLVERFNKKAMNLSTVSKVLKTLEDDLIIERQNRIRLLQPDKLLEKLSKNYVSPIIKECARINMPGGLETTAKLLKKESRALGLPLVATATSSIKRYAVMQREDILSVYCPRIEKLLERLPGSQSDRFPNLELIETEDETAYFDCRQEENFYWASPVQVYLDLMTGDKRDRESAEQVRSYIMNSLEVSNSCLP